MPFEEKKQFSEDFKQHCIAKLRLGNTSLAEIKQALSRCSNEYGIIVSQDHTGLPGFVVKLESSASRMTAEEVENLLEDMTTHLTAMRRARVESVSSAGRKAPTTSGSTSTSDPRKAYTNKPKGLFKKL